MWESQVLITDSQVDLPRVLRFSTALMNDRFDISEIFSKGRETQIKKKKKKKKKKSNSFALLNKKAAMPLYGKNT